MSIGPSVLTFTFASGHITLNARVLVQSLTTWEHWVLLTSKPFLISVVTYLTIRSVTHVAN